MIFLCALILTLEETNNGSTSRALTNHFLKEKKLHLILGILRRKNRCIMWG